MWRLKREDVPGCPDAVRVSVEALDAAEASTAPLTDAALIATLRGQLTAQQDLIEQLRVQSAAEGTRTPDDAGLTGRQAEEISDLRQQRDDALARLRDHETADRDGTCACSVGYQRTIATLREAAAADRRRIAELDKALRTVRGAVAHAEAHRELAAEASG